MIPRLLNLIYLFVCTRIVASVANGYDEFWNREVEESLKKNIRGECKWKMSQGFDIPEEASDTFLVSRHFPTHSEIEKFQKLPSTLTRANANLLNLAHYTGYQNWSKVEESQWQIIYDHPSQNRSFCYGLTKLAAEEKYLDLYNHFRTPQRAMYLLRKRNGLISQTGSVAFECGFFQGKEGCETRWDGNVGEWFNKCRKYSSRGKNWFKAFSNPDPNDFEGMAKKNESIKQLVNATTLWETYEDQWKELNKTGLFQPHFYKRVFVITTQWDYNYHHFIADSLIRVIRNIKFLRTNPDVYIHIRAMENYDTVPIRSVEFKESCKAFRDKFFGLLGIEAHRIISDIVFADEVYIPRCVHCGYALSNPMEVRLLTKELLKGANAAATPAQQLKIQANLKNPFRKKNLIIQQRYSEVESDRTWQNSTFDEVVTEFTLMFPEHNIVRMSSINNSPDNCLACEIREYSNADILVGMHGAGLTNLMFMPPGSLVVEFVGHFENVHMPVCGYYEPKRADQAAKRAAEFYKAIKSNERDKMNITTVPYYNYKYKT